jgi:hypothetical protein
MFGRCLAGSEDEITRPKLDLKQAEISAFVRPCRQWLSRSIADRVTFRTTCERKFQIPMVYREKVFAVEHCFREAGAGGSNPLTPTSFSTKRLDETTRTDSSDGAQRGSPTEERGLISSARAGIGGHVSGSVRPPFARQPLPLIWPRSPAPSPARARDPSGRPSRPRTRRSDRRSAIVGTSPGANFHALAPRDPRGFLPGRGAWDPSCGGSPATARGRQSKWEINGLGARGQNP